MWPDYGEMVPIMIRCLVVKFEFGLPFIGFQIKAPDDRAK